MKNLIKSFMFAVAMLLAVSVQAENKPETVAGTNPESATVVTVQPNDVQQVPCILVIASTRCDFETNIGISVANSSDCDMLENFIYSLLALTNC